LKAIAESRQRNPTQQEAPQSFLMVIGVPYPPNDKSSASARPKGCESK
jgi:hypothetical protein